MTEIAPVTEAELAVIKASAEAGDEEAQNLVAAYWYAEDARLAFLRQLERWRKP